MDIYKDYLQQLRKVALEIPFLYILDHDIFIPLKLVVKNIIHTKFGDGEYHKLFGHIKKHVHIFLQTWVDKMDELIKKSDEVTHTAGKNDLLAIIDFNIGFSQSIQQEFEKAYLPATTALEEKKYEEVKVLYNSAMEKIYEYKERVNKFDMPVYSKEFAKEISDLGLQRRKEMFDFSHTFISLHLAERLSEIRESLEEILCQSKNNLKQMQEQGELYKKDLTHELYDSNKEYLDNKRQTQELSCAESMRRIEKVKYKMNSNTKDNYMYQLKTEVDFWSSRLEEFRKIADTLDKLKKEKDRTIAQEQQYNSMRTTEYPGTKFRCWENMGVNFIEHKQFIEQSFIKTAKSLLTFFHVKGRDRIMYHNDVGAFYLDEHGHQVYCLDSDYRTHHRDCDGNPVEITEGIKHYYDENGRYILNASGEKIYQLAPCCSQYKLDENNLMQKVTVDCGHSNAFRRHCKMTVCDPNVLNMLLPPILTDPSFKDKLDPDSAKYLWEAFGGILPEVLVEVVKAEPRNPIHYFAHKLLYHRYRLTTEELAQKNKIAKAYQEDKVRRRKEKKAAAEEKRKSKLVKRRKPEESDDTEERVAFNTYLTNEAFKNNLNYYYD